MTFDELLSAKAQNPKDWEAFQAYWNETRQMAGLAGLDIAYEFWKAGQVELVKRVAASAPAAIVRLAHGRENSYAAPGGLIEMIDKTMEAGTRLYKL